MEYTPDEPTHSKIPIIMGIVSAIIIVILVVVIIVLVYKMRTKQPPIPCAQIIPNKQNNSPSTSSIKSVSSPAVSPGYGLWLAAGNKNYADSQLYCQKTGGKLATYDQLMNSGKNYKWNDCTAGWLDHCKSSMAGTNIDIGPCSGWYSNTYNCGLPGKNIKIAGADEKMATYCVGSIPTTSDVTKYVVGQF